MNDDKLIKAMDILHKNAAVRDYLEAGGAGALLGALMGGGIGAIGSEKGELLKNIGVGAGVGGAIGGLGGLASGDSWKNFKRDVKNAGGLKAYFRDRPKPATAADEKLVALLQRGAPGSEVVNTIPMHEFRKDYGEGLDKELEEASRYAKEKGLPFDMAERIKKNRIIRTLLLKGELGHAWASWTHTYRDQHGKMHPAQAITAGDKTTAETARERMTPLQLIVNGLSLDGTPPKNLRKPPVGEERKKDLRESLMHELTHGLSATDSGASARIDKMVEARLTNPDEPGSVANQLKQIYGGSMPTLKQLKDDGFLDVLYPELPGRSAEIVPPLSAVQRYVYGKTGKRITSDKEYVDFINDNEFNLKTDTDFEKHIEDMPTEVQRFLRYRRTMRKGRGTPAGIRNRRYILFDMLNKMLMPGIVKSEGGTDMSKVAALPVEGPSTKEGIIKVPGVPQTQPKAPSTTSKTEEIKEEGFRRSLGHAKAEKRIREHKEELNEYMKWATALRRKIYTAEDPKEAAKHRATLNNVMKEVDMVVRQHERWRADNIEAVRSVDIVDDGGPADDTPAARKAYADERTKAWMENAGRKSARKAMFNELMNRAADLPYSPNVSGADNYTERTRRSDFAYTMAHQPPGDSRDTPEAYRSFADVNDALAKAKSRQEQFKITQEKYPSRVSPPPNLDPQGSVKRYDELRKTMPASKAIKQFNNPAEESWLRKLIDQGFMTSEAKPTGGQDMSKVANENSVIHVNSGHSVRSASNRSGKRFPEEPTHTHPQGGVYKEAAGNALKKVLSAASSVPTPPAKRTIKRSKLSNKLLARFRGKNPGEPGKPTSLMKEFRRQYFKNEGDLERVLKEVGEYAKKTNMPVNMAENIKADLPIRRIVAPSNYQGQARHPKGTYYQPAHGSMADYGKTQATTGTMAMDPSSARKVSRVNKLDAEAMGLRPEDYEGFMTNMKSVKEAIGHEIRHAASTPRQDDLRRFRSPSRAVETDPEILAWYNLASMRPKGGRKWHETYPEMNLEEVFPQLGALQQWHYRKTGKRLLSPEAYDEFVEPYVSIKDFDEFERAIMDMPVEVKRHMRNLRTIKMDTANPQRAETMMRIFRKWAPGTMGIAGGGGMVAASQGE